MSPEVLEKIRAAWIREYDELMRDETDEALRAGYRVTINQLRDALTFTGLVEVLAEDYTQKGDMISTLLFALEGSWDMDDCDALFYAMREMSVL